MSGLKRPRSDNQEPSHFDDQETDGTENLLDLLQGDDFVTEEERQRREAEDRRLKRRQRLEQAKQLEKEKPTENPFPPSRPMKFEKETAMLKSESVSGEMAVQPQGYRLTLNNEDDADKGEDSSEDGYDMFSGSLSPPEKDKEKTQDDKNMASGATKRGHEQEDWDDAEGYYNAVIGEAIHVDNPIVSSNGQVTTGTSSISFRVTGVVGKGVFSTVLKAATTSNSSSVELPPVVALKCIRHNESMSKAAMKEIRTLQRLRNAPGIVPLLMPTTPAPIEHRGHVLMVFSFMEYNLREVLQKFGKGVGLSLQAVRSYFGQLLAAATHLKKHGIIHADLKPDNILVSADFGVVKLADFGSAIEPNSPESNQPTPYMVSRFYRAPEIILGLVPTYSIDLWSIAVSVAELFLGDVLFRGASNNDMLYVFMQHLGPFSNRIIRQHLAQCQRLPGILPRQFQQEGTS